MARWTLARGSGRYYPAAKARWYWKKGVGEGRRTFSNMLGKYSSRWLIQNFGNVFSVLVASIRVLPRLTAAALAGSGNPAYDVSGGGVPFDVDEEQIQKPQRWSQRIWGACGLSVRSARFSTFWPLSDVVRVFHADTPETPQNFVSRSAGLARFDYCRKHLINI